MLEPKLFGEELKKRGFTFFSGVPCSFLKYLINYVVNEQTYIMAANEGDAVAICAGAYLGGAKPVFFCQNSGLTNASSPLTSLNYIFHIPVLGFVSLRGEPGVKDEPQHELMGRITTDFLSLMEIEWEFLEPDLPAAIRQLEKADALFEKGRSFFFVVRKGTFAGEELKKAEMPARPAPGGAPAKIEKKQRADALPSRIAALETLVALNDEKTVLLATTGFTGRELYEIKDRPNNFYMVGSMGCVSSLGLGLALTQPDKKIVVLDGDGSLLMRMGALATNAYYAPDNLFHLLLDNNCHLSTGGQATVAHNVDFVGVAAAAGFRNAYYLHDLADLERVWQEWEEAPAPVFAHLKVAKETKENLGRPGIKPYEVKERLMAFLAGAPAQEEKQ